MANDSHAHFVMAALEGKRPIQMPNVNAGLLASWMRSVTEHGLEPDRIQEPDVLTHAELLERRAPIEEMSAFSSPEIDRLYQHLSDHAQVVMLSDAQGVVIHFRSNSTVVDTCSALRVLPGSIWSEDKQGTTGVGLCLREQKPLSIVMAEHFATKLAGLSCTVAPIFGAEGRLVGVLNVTAMRSTDHALQGVVREMVANSARRIENVFFDRRHARARILRLSRHDDFCDAAAEARLALDDNGRIIDATPPALRLLTGSTLNDRPDVLIGRKLSSIVDVGNVERLLQEAAPTINGKQGCIHVRVTEPPRRAASRAPQIDMLSRASRLAASTLSTSGTRASVAPTLEEIVGSDTAMLDRLRIAQRLHARCLPLLLQGESGCGKTQLARALHEDGPHRSGGFVAINCAAIPQELIESELFGHRSGAFTGAAKQGAPGRLLGANDGTLFLDEIGDMPLGLQGRLLQVLSEGEFVPVGATQPVKVRFALISATLRDLKSLVQEGRFREDLYYRLSGATLALPPLRERTDLGQLIERAFARAALEAGIEESRLSQAARDVLLRHRWPGNIRELQHVAKFTAAINDSEVIGLDALPASLIEQADARHPAGQTRPAATRTVSDAESLLDLMEQSHWNVSAAAARLGISRATLHRRLNEFDVHRPRKPH
ncbi:GAF modulated sigma54 specific transcriptional regulator, Fis family [Leptothrix cholodnii SP-6]|uniref:GAF modulated sigma54 specific transcriptional regulator, Fis family n=2 Tax=Leptothrix cholodnii TaxID=34029 RepID=B1Y1U6_LEPCP|nr:GAF modulated sigma54 specific transcriptional regulator, Fis family [Leptothrix cholodnii SP-6]